MFGMEDPHATAEDVKEILELTGWSIRHLANYWGCTEAVIYQWLRAGIVTRGLPTWCVRKTLEEAKAGARRQPVRA